MSNPLAGWRIINCGTSNDVVNSSCRREQELRARIKEAHQKYVELSKGKDEAGRMDVMRRLQYLYGFNSKSILNGYPTM